MNSKEKRYGPVTPNHLAARFRKRMPWPCRIAFFSFILGLILWVSPGSEVRADTSFMAGDGENLVYGFSTLDVNLPDPKGKLRTVRARLVGTIRGKPVVATWENGGENKLFMVTIIDSKKARFSDQEQNVIPVQTVESWRNILVPNGSLTIEENITRILEMPAPDKPATESVLLLVNGTQDLRMLSLSETSDQKSKARLLKAREVKRWHSSRRYINLDLIDLNTYVANKKDVEKIPTAIAVWYQRENLFFNWNLTRMQANSLALASLSNDGLNLYQKLEEGWFWGYMGEGPDPWKQKNKTDYGSMCVTGGAFVNPDHSGSIAYWFGANFLFYDRKGKTHRQTFRLQTHKQILYFDGNRIMFKVPDDMPFTLESSWEWYVEDSSCEDANIRRARYIRHLTGPRIRRGDADAIYVDNYLKPDKADEGPNWGAGESKVQGKLHELHGDWQATGVSPYDGMSDDNLTEMQKKERQLENLGANVVMVIYGWPYFGVKGKPSTLNTPSLSRSDSTQKIKWTKSSNGGGFESEVGFKFGLARKYEASAIGGAAWDKGDQNTTVETAAATLEAMYHETQTTFERFQKWGLVVFNLIKPTVLKYGRFVPGSASPEDEVVIRAPGLEGYRFEFPVVNLGVDSDTNLEMRRFDMTDPNYELDEEGAPSPLSKGLAPRTVHTVTAQDWSRDLDRIVKWEHDSDNRIRDFIALAESRTQPSSVTGLKVMHAYTYNLGENKTMAFSKTYSKEEFNSRTWYSGGKFKVEPRSGWGPVATLSGRYTDSFSTSDTEVEGKAYRMTQRGIDDDRLARVHFKTYFIDVDIDKLQSFIIRSKGEPFKAKPAVIPDWNWNHKQDFTLVITVKGNVYMPR